METLQINQISHIKSIYSWLQSIEENYSVNFFYDNIQYCIDSEKKDIVRIILEHDIDIEDVIKTDAGNYALKSELNECCGIFWHDHENTPDDIVFDEINNEHIHIEDAIYGHVRKIEAYFSSDERYFEYGNDYYHENSLSYHDLVIGHDGDILHLDYAAFCEDIQDYCHIDEAYYCENSECWYRYAENMQTNEGKEHISNYHDSPCAEDLSNNSLFKVGYEIEKTDFFGNNNKGDHVGDYDIFKGFELDSSCGVEAITNILPLSVESFEYVKNLMNDAKDVINSDISSNCGGHITFSISGISGSEIYDMIKPYIGIFYAMYRHRLTNTYCNGNKDLKDKNAGKYSTINIKGNLVELRIPPAVKNVNQLFFRHQMTFQLLFAAYNKLPFEQYLDNCQHLLKSVYKDNSTINELSILFKEYIDTGILKPIIQRFIQD